MSRARRARRIAAAAAFGGGGVGVLGAAGIALLFAEARLARRWIGQQYRTGKGRRSARSPPSVHR